MFEHSDSTFVVNTCDSYTWMNGQTYTDTTMGEVYTIRNAHSCDSVNTLNLTIRYSSERHDTVKACDSYIWRLGDNERYVTTPLTVPTDTITNRVRCDSVLFLHLTVYQTPTTVTVVSTNNTYCVGSNGTITMVAPLSHGDTIYEYSLDGTTYQTSTFFSGLASGTYTVYARCVGSECPGTTTVVLTDDRVNPNVTLPIVPAYCEGDTVNITPSVSYSDNRVATYTYLWEDGGTFSTSSQTLHIDSVVYT